MKWIIRFNYGYGDDYEVIDADSREEAERAAYEAWREAAESQADYSAEEYTEEMAEELDLL